jgi:hypothetical protein
MTFKYPFFRKFRSFKVTVSFIDTYIVIKGPEVYVDDVIEIAKR